MEFIWCIFKSNFSILTERQVRESRYVAKIDFYFPDIFYDIFPESLRRTREVTAKFNILKIGIHLQLFIDDNNLIIIKTQRKKD